MKSFYYAAKGIVIAVKEQRNIKIHLLAMVVVCLAGFYFHISDVEWMICVLCFSVVIAAEMINTAIEYLVDLVQPSHHPLAGKIKDIAAGAVFITAIGAAIIGLFIFLKYILLATH